jgi:hypothetical protein
MKKMSFEEFSKRVAEIDKANKIFGNLTGNNISQSFAMYQEILAEEKMEVFISTAEGGDRAPTIMDDYERPKCPECDTYLRLKIAPVDAEGHRWNTAWVCIKCSAEYYSENTVEDWMRELNVSE